MMFRSIAPLLALVTSVALFLTFTQPTYKDTQTIQSSISEYATAMKNADELKRRVETLITQRGNFSEADMARLKTFLPDDVNEVDAVVALDALAKKHRLSFGSIVISSSEIHTAERTTEQTSDGASTLEKNLRVRSEMLATGEFAEDAANAADTSPDADGTPKQNNFAPVLASFSVVGSYDDFRAFVADVERSLLFIDITTITIAQSEAKKMMTFQVGISLYEFKPRI